MQTSGQQNLGVHGKEFISNVNILLMMNNSRHTCDPNKKHTQILIRTRRRKVLTDNNSYFKMNFNVYL